jgi:CheY-like chemotaxis protein
VVTTSGKGAVVVLDAHQAWARAATAGRQVVVVEPKRDLAKRLAELKPARVVVNLASPGALDAILSLRAGGFSGAFSGCLADPAANLALPLRLVEAAARPLDPDAIVAALGRFAKKGARIVTVGDDVEALVSLRQALAREGMSVSMAWNGRQADDLFPVVRPTAVVLDLELPAKEGPGVVARLALGAAVPDLVLIAGAADPATDFAAALASAPRDSRMLSLGRLVTQTLRGAE